MCGRYALYDTSQILTRFGVSTPQGFKLRESYNVAPGQTMPVVIATDKGWTLEPMKWGLVPHWAKDDKIGYKLINARSEGAFDKPTWRGPVKHHRCLVPAHGFYEWKAVEGERTKQPYFIHPSDQELFAFAGVYDTWRAPDGSELRSFSIMTTEPNKEMEDIHNRMPVILMPEDESIWLDPSLEEREVLEALLQPYPDGKLEMYEVSRDVNTPAKNEEYLIYPLSAQ